MMRSVFRNFDVVIIISTFFPYLLPSFGLRMEHICIYLIFGILLFKGELFPVREKSLLPILFLFSSIMVIVGISSFINNVKLNIEILPYVENYVETLVLLILFAGLFNKRNYFTPHRIIKLNTLFHVLLALNTLIILLEIFTPYSDTILSYYVRHDISDRMATSSMGRYMGIFDQPLVSGLAYSLGLLTWIYNWKRKNIKNFWFEGLLLLLIIIGGLASVSKVFFLGGIILSVITFLVLGNLRSNLLFITIGIFPLFLITRLFILNWEGSHYLSELVFGITDEFSLDKITSGRIGNNSGIYTEVLKQDISILVGKGFTQGKLPYFDSEYVQVFYQGGGLALLLYFIIIIINFTKCIYLDRRLFVEKVLFIALLSLGVFSALGGPVLLMNRVRVFFILQLFFMYKLGNAVFHGIERAQTNIR